MGGVQDTLPGTVAQVMELVPSCFHAQAAGSIQTKPSNWVNVPPVDLKGPLPWYKSIVGAADTTEESPGVLCLVGATTNNVTVEFFIVMDFKTAVAPANTPLEIRARQEMRLARQQRAALAQQRLVARVLAGVPTSGVVLPAEPPRV